MAPKFQQDPCFTNAFQRKLSKCEVRYYFKANLAYTEERATANMALTCVINHSNFKKATNNNRAQYGPKFSKDEKKNTTVENYLMIVLGLLYRLQL